MNENEIKSAMDEAMKLYREEQLDKSIELFQVLRKDTGVGSELMRWVNTFEAWPLLRTGKTERAMELWDRAFDIRRVSDPVNPIALIGMALSMAHHNEDIAEDYAFLAMKMFAGLPDNQDKERMIDYSMPHIITCGVTFVHSENFAGATRILEEAIEASSWLEMSDDPEIARSAMHYSEKCEHWYDIALKA